MPTPDINFLLRLINKFRRSFLLLHSIHFWERTISHCIRSHDFASLEIARNCYAAILDHIR